MEPTEADPGPALRPDAFPVHRLALVEDIDKGDEVSSWMFLPSLYSFAQSWLFTGRSTVGDGVCSPYLHLLEKAREGAVRRRGLPRKQER